MGEYDHGLSLLPEGCLSEMISKTSTKDACRASAVSRGFKSASESDAVWERFLPSDYPQIISKSDTPLNFSTKKELFFLLCDLPILINDRTQCFRLCKASGKKCFMLRAKELSIAWKDTPSYWNWKSSSESRFSEVAELLNVCWFDIHGKMHSKLLSPKTTYAAYLVYKITDESFGLEAISKSCVKFAGDDANVDECDTVHLTPMLYRPLYMRGRRRRRTERRVDGRVPRERMDGWLEICLGEFYKDEVEGEIEVRLSETEILNWKNGLILEGIEFRPREDGLDSTYPTRREEIEENA